MALFPITLTVTTLLFLLLAVAVNSEDPYHFHTWDVKYATLSPLGVSQQVITINDQFPGPRLNGTSNNNIVVNVFNHLDEPLLFTWNGIQQRKNSWQEGTLATNCPIQPGTNMTYKFQVKDQIGSYFYYPTTALHRSAGGYGPITVHSRELIPVPFDWPEDEFIVLVGDWYTKGHVALKKQLDSGKSLGRPVGVVINGKSGKGDGKDEPLFTMIPKKTYRYRFCNVGMKNSINVRFQKHSMKLVEVEGSHTVQNVYDSLDVHLGQCYSVLVEANQDPMDYYLIASTRFTKEVLTTTAVIRYAGSKTPPHEALPAGPVGWAWSLNQFRSQRWNLTASAARPNPQGSYHYGKINITRTIKIVNSAGAVDGKLRYAINGVSHTDGETPVKLAQYFGVADKVFKYNLIKDEPGEIAADKISVAANVVNATFRDFIEIIFENPEKSVQSWHLAGYSFFAVAIEPGKWTKEKRVNYNLLDAVSRNTIQVYPGCWAAIMLTMDNAGLWNLRAGSVERSYLGQQLYFSVLSPELSLRDEYNIPEDQLLCGIVKDMPRPKLYTI
ncbi:SKU5 similar 11 [Perilla frutescens var. hirtella]|uniref:SKU5 similar 11 n=1 Tax=Perilla frutescens var. hirtella TaxID=608512 RepID=A0AAD4P3E4_PERFH|nr:SKU5 similar 11 [Perilla frutescens var. hirtella]KAH6825458.1 SKU5 similar 11 [Perilla frutescens var. hirtella]